MAKKKKIRTTVYGSVEGIREKIFLTHLVETYKPRNNNINPNFPEPSGGAPDKIIGQAITNADRDRSFAWLDEDFEPKHPLSENWRRKLAGCWNIVDPEHLHALLKCPLKDLESNFNLSKRKPRLIVSQPVCVESIILKVLGKKLPYEHYDPRKRSKQIETLKEILEDIVGEGDELQFYRENLTQDILEEKRKEIPELDVLISMLTP